MFLIAIYDFMMTLNTLTLFYEVGLNADSSSGGRAGNVYLKGCHDIYGVLMDEKAEKS